MDDLVRWYGEQLDEDAARARACPGNGEWTAQDIALYGPELSPEVRTHMAAHGPARVLREIDAKRHLLKALLSEGHAALRPGGSTEIYCGADYGAGDPCDCGREERVASYLRLLAAVYQDRPGYREDWRP